MKTVKTDIISVVASALNEEGNLPELYAQIRDALLPAGIEFELVLIDNGSGDATWQVMKDLGLKDPRVKALRLSRTFGHQEAMLAGMDHASGAAVVTMDSDLQHPPEIIPEMVALWKKGSSVVYTTKKKDYGIGLFRLLLTKFFYFLISKVSGLKLSFGQSDFRLLDRRVVEVILSIDERPKFLRGLVDWVGFPRAGIEYSVRKRQRGVSTYNFRRLVDYGLNGIFSFSMLPLRLFLTAGIGISLLCVAYAVYAVTVKALSVYFPSVVSPPGWTTITVSVLFLSSIQLIGIGLIGEYIGRIYNQVKGRPEYIVRDRTPGFPTGADT
jgi:dolichol-phosphate mannosyltransferase